MDKQTSAFERLWHWTYEAKSVYRSKGGSDASDLHVPLLDINPEGRLEREIKDIIEELDIMIHITKTQEDILKKFITYAQNQLQQLANKEADSGSNTSNEIPIFGPNESFKWFNRNATERSLNIQDRINKLTELRETAMNTATSVSDLSRLLPSYLSNSAAG